MLHTRVAVYKFKPGTADQVIRQAAEGMMPIFQSQPGFVSYQIVKTGDDSGVSISTWRSHDAATAAIGSAAEWVQGTILRHLVSVENYVGELALSVPDVGSAG